MIDDCYLLPGAADNAAHAALLTVLDVNLLDLDLSLGSLVLTTLSRLTTPGEHLNNKGLIFKESTSVYSPGCPWLSCRDPPDPGVRNYCLSRSGQGRHWTDSSQTRIGCSEPRGLDFNVKLDCHLDVFIVLE